MSKSTYLANALINHTLRADSGPAFVRPSVLYVAMFTSPPGLDGLGGSEVVGGGYVRTTTLFGPPTNGTAANSQIVSFPDANNTWGVLKHFAIFDAIVNGNMLYLDVLGIPRTVGAGNKLIFPVGQLVVTEF